MGNCDHQDAADLYEPLWIYCSRPSQAAPDVPKVRGPAAKEAALDMLRQLQTGEVKRENLGEEYSHF